MPYGSIIRDGVNYSHDTAESISFDNTSTSVVATDVQGAIEELASSSGSGGHTIVNDAGTDMTQRTDLQFSGVYVSDNSAGDVTEVNVVRSLTKTQIENLSGEALKGFQECTTEESDLPLTSDVVECANNQSLTDVLDNTQDILIKNGSKNLLHFPYYTTDDSMFTTDSDGIITLNRIETTSVRWLKYLIHKSEKFTLPKGKYIISKGIDTPQSASSIYICVDAYNGTTWIKCLANSYTPDENEFEVDYNGYDRIEVYLSVDSGVSITENIKLYPMLRLASDQDSTFQPYAATNRQLTISTQAESIELLTITQSGTARSTDIVNKSKRLGNLAIINVTFTSAISSSTSPGMLYETVSDITPSINSAMQCVRIDSNGDILESIPCYMLPNGIIWVKTVVSGSQYILTGCYTID